MKVNLSRESSICAFLYVTCTANLSEHIYPNRMLFSASKNIVSNVEKSNSFVQIVFQVILKFDSHAENESRKFDNREEKVFPSASN